jgi:microcystin-dependent protein
MSSPFVGEIRIFPYNFPPRGWAFCNGQLMAISQNTALFSLLGTSYGGNGTSTFGLPNFLGRVPVHQGQAPGLSLYALGENGGSTSITLLLGELPQHAHNLKAFTGRGVTAHAIPASGDAMTASAGGPAYAPTGSGLPMAPNALSTSGGSTAHDNSMPTLAFNYCIALQGIYPARN